MSDVFEELPSLYLEIGGTRIYFPADTLSTKAGNRLAKHRRLYRDGARIDDMGCAEDVYEVRGKLYEQCEDPAVLVQGIPCYPDLANLMREVVRVHDVGDFMHPREGLKRVRVEALEITEVADERSAAVYVLALVEDNEDEANADAFEPANGYEGLRPAAFAAVAAAQDAGITGDPLETLGRAVAILEGPTPEEAIAIAVVQPAMDLYVGCKEAFLAIEDQRPFESFGEDAGIVAPDSGTPRDPGSPIEHAAIRELARIMDRAARIAAAARARRRQRPETIERPTTLFNAAHGAGNDIEAVLAANPDVDPFEVPEGKPIQVELVAQRVAL